MKECWNEFIRAKGWQNSICCAGLNGVTLGAKTCGGKKIWPFIILYMVHKPRYLRRVARVGKSQIESKDS